MATPGIAVPGSPVPANALLVSGGAQGIQGIAGPAGPPPYTTTTAPFTMPPAGGTVNVTVADASWVIIGSMLTVQTAGGNPTTAASLRCTAKSGNQLTLLYQPPTIVPIASTLQAGLLNQVSGNVLDYIGGDNSPHPLIAPTAEYYDQDDFLNAPGGTTNVWISKLFACAISGSAGAVAGPLGGNYPGHPGILQLAPGTVASSWSRALMNGALMFLDGNITITIQGVMSVGGGAFLSTNQFCFGLVSSMGPVLPATAYAAMFYCAASSGPNWLCFTRNSSTNTQSIDSGVPVTNAVNWLKFRIVATLGSVQFFIEDNLITTITDNSIPVGTQPLYIGFWTNNGATTNNYSLVVDCFDVWLQPVAQSGQSPTRFMRSIR